MIKVTVLYPYTEGKFFDIDYYSTKHIPMTQQLLGPACKGVAVDHGIAGGQPGTPPAYIALSHLLFDSVEAFQAAIAPVMEQLAADMPNYTDIAPTFQVSEVKL